MTGHARGLGSISAAITHCHCQHIFKRRDKAIKKEMDSETYQVGHRPSSKHFG